MTRVFSAVAGAAWRDHPGRLALCIFAIALGVALGVAVHLINASAAGEFTHAVRTLAGEADLVVRGPRAGFPDALYAKIARLPGIDTASPAVELDAQLAGVRDTIKVLGIDPFRAAAVQRELLPESREAIGEMLRPGTVVLSQPAAAALKLREHDVLRIHAGSGIVNLDIVAVLPAGATRQHLAVMDIANAQWQLGRIGVLHRIDLKLAPGADAAHVRDEVQALLPPGVIVSTPEAESARYASLSRAYRLNLDMLALVALFTGAFLVFSMQFLALVRRRAQFALMRVLGLTRTALARLLVIEAALLGVVGAALGIALGVALAQYGLTRLGGDLGAGYFSSVQPSLKIVPATLALFFVLGVAFAALGAAIPAREAANRAPALALRAGDEEEALRGFQSIWPALALIACGGMLAQAPAVSGVPVAGYVAIALILLGAILAMPRMAELVLKRLPLLTYPPAALAGAQLQATPRQAGVSLAAILASFSLMVAMLIMVGSFRESLAHWLEQMLPADLYVRAGRLGETGFFTREEQQRLAQLNAVREIVYIRSQNVFMRADLPPVTLLARPISMETAARTLALSGRAVSPGASDPPPVWISEVAADLLHLVPGERVDIPVGGSRVSFFVAGVWRDYARQNGAIAMDRTLYTALTGDDRANDAAIFLRGGASFDDAAAQIRAALSNPEAVEITPTRNIKAGSLATFDRTFAVTYALEIAAVIIGLFGVSASFGAQALARRREFGVLRHLGITRSEIAVMLGCEGAIVGTLGVAAGLATGWLVSVVLVHVINRQSFHWSMDMHVPWTTLGALALAIVGLAAITAIVSGRRAMGEDVVGAVREDW